MINVPFRSFSATLVVVYVENGFSVPIPVLIHDDLHRDTSIAPPPAPETHPHPRPTPPADKPRPYHSPSSNRTNVKSGVSALSSTSTAFGTAASNNRLDHTGNGHIDEALRQQALAEEEAAMNQYKVPTSGISFAE